VLAVFGPEVTGVGTSVALEDAEGAALVDEVAGGAVSTIDDLREGARKGATAAAAALVEAG
jgi:hypothetical protein